jgi:hypothetical protein
VRVDATSAEYWDRSGAEGLKFLFEGLKAVVQGRSPDIAEPERHGRVTQMPGVE